MADPPTPKGDTVNVDDYVELLTAAAERGDTKRVRALAARLAESSTPPEKPTEPTQPERHADPEAAARAEGQALLDAMRRDMPDRHEWETDR